MKNTPLRQCPSCGEQSESQFEACWNCGEALPVKSVSGFRVKPVVEPEVQSAEPLPIFQINASNNFSFVWVWMTVIIAALAIMLGNVHIVTGGPFSSLQLVQRVSYGYSDIYVDADALSALPPYLGFAQSPMAYLALYRDGLLSREHYVKPPPAAVNLE